MNLVMKVFYLPIVFEVNIIDDAKAKSHQSKLLNMFEVDSTPTQLGMSGENKLLLKLDNEVSKIRAIENLKNLERNKNSISAIDEIQNYLAPIELNTEKSNYKIKFIDFHNPNLNTKVNNYFKSYLKQKEIAFNEFNYTDDEHVIEVSNITLDELNFIRELPLKSIEPMPYIEDPFPVLEEGDSEENFISFDESKKYPLVGLLDSGVEILPQLLGFVERGQGCNYAETDLNKDHGTFIATLLVHGNALNGVRDSSIEGCKIIDVPVNKIGGVSEGELIENIKRAVELNSHVKIWSLSVSISKEMNEDRFSDFAIALDEIQKKYNVLIIKSSGNDPRSYVLNQEPRKLSQGADAVRALTVGSLIRNSDSYAVSKANFPSFYSRAGRGPASIIKPEVVHYGGDFFANTHVPQSVVDYDTVSERSLKSDGSFCLKVGTSYSTPKVAKLAAELCLELGLDESNFNPLLIRALIIHSAQYLENPSLSEDMRLKRLGFGKPHNSEYILGTETPTSVTFMLSGNLRKKHKIDIMDFPYPRNLIKDGIYTGRIKVTLVYDNYLEKDMGPEYCQSNLDLKMGTYDEKFDRDISKKMILNPIGRDQSQNLLKNKLYGKKKIRDNQSFQFERNLIEYGDKYYPVKKFSADLSEMTDANSRNYIGEERNWFLYLEGQYRDFIYKKVRSDDSKLSMDFVLLITIADADDEEDLHTEATQLLEHYGFNYNYIEVDETIHLQVDEDL